MGVLRAGYRLPAFAVFLARDFGEADLDLGLEPDFARDPDLALVERDLEPPGPDLEAVGRLRDFERPEPDFELVERDLDPPEAAFARPAPDFDPPDAAFARPEPDFELDDRDLALPEPDFELVDRDLDPPEAAFARPEPLIPNSCKFCLA